jgi:hypothetical protein
MEERWWKSTILAQTGEILYDFKFVGRKVS